MSVKVVVGIVLENEVVFFLRADDDHVSVIAVTPVLGRVVVNPKWTYAEKVHPEV